MKKMLESFDNTKRKCMECKSYFTPALREASAGIFLPHPFCSEKCFENYFNIQRTEAEALTKLTEE
jgi:hypothetical protein